MKIPRRVKITAKRKADKKKAKLLETHVNWLVEKKLKDMEKPLKELMDLLIYGTKNPPRA